MVACVHNPNGYDYYYNEHTGTRREGTRWGEVWPHEDGTAHATTTGMYIRDRRTEFPDVPAAVAHVQGWIMTGAR
jgi:hypothetical protein